MEEKLTDEKSINEIVKDLVDVAQMTQKEIGEIVGLSQPVVSALYRGDQKDVGYDKAGKKLADLHRAQMAKAA
jgi:predicted XRE-type DNA-binding protein